MGPEGPDRFSGMVFRWWCCVVGARCWVLVCLPVCVGWVRGVLVVGAGGVVVLRVAGRSVIGRFLLLVSVGVSFGGCVSALGVGVLRWVRVGAARFLRTAQWTRASLWSS